MIIDSFDMVKYTVIFAGAVMLANGVFDIVFMILMRRGLKQAEKAAEEAAELVKAGRSRQQAKRRKDRTAGVCALEFKDRFRKY